MSLRNIAIIAHVDHGKTTLVDSMFRQSGVYRDNQRVDERAMDSNDLERERGITIVAKPTAVQWGDTRVNIVDTPGHADFGGEVERILSMVEGVVLLVDSAEGPMPQTKFVLGKALKLGLRPIVIINKIDRPDQRAEEVLDEIFDLFVSLEASDEQLDFPVLYASGRDGWAAESPEGPKDNLTPLMELVLKHVPAPDVDENAPFAMLATMLHADNFLGRILTGRVYQGRAKLNMPVKVLREDGTVETGRLSKLMGFRGLERVPQDEAVAGDIIAIAGLTEATVADTICSTEVTKSIESQPIDPPTLAMTFSVNNSPLAGQEGDKVTSRMIRARLEREAEGNIAIKIGETADKDAFEVAGRGELQLGVLVETMRREGFELSISRPRVLFQEIDGVLSEPFEEVQVDVDEEYSGVVVEKMSLRKAEMTDMRSSGGGKTRIIFIAPSRGLIGYHGEFLTDTRGTGVMNRVFHSYGPVKGSIAGRRNGALISNDQGDAVAYALFNLEDRGIMFIEPGERVYQGMIVGEHNRDNDLEINVLKGKKLTNVRASGKDDAILLTPPRRMSLEEALSYIQDDELVEVTPQSVRIRKQHLDPNVRKRESRKKEG
ncbi:MULTISPECIES: translational GTPase TypA [unclassified Thalassospira]|uniref:translational GTPase TypA n=2 Tax=Thalassospira TaxID=168934 RepID=UPI000C47EB83|nr:MULTISPECIES: translational GTPase TypA [unclassified Thalassospira]MBC44668.1 translational GTPase TypA [Thalassospira sp.]MBO6806514.1 translational GTPase TypA [Thalassospira sp.]MBO6838965.1 translational GTPase TypA [Thalassospira sp.]HCK17245.1 translational GTPase TypA [Thalassospira sp.]